MACTDVALVIVSAVHFCNIITVSGLLLLSFDCYRVCVFVCVCVYMCVHMWIFVVVIVTYMYYKLLHDFII